MQVSLLFFVFLKTDCQDLGPDPPGTWFIMVPPGIAAFACLNEDKGSATTHIFLLTNLQNYQLIHSVT